MERNIENSKYAAKAMAIFKEGYNCAQSVAMAFDDLVDMSRDDLAKLASSFGGGFGGLREVCGCVSGMTIVCSLLHGYTDPKDSQVKKEHYDLVKELANEFKEENGTIICKELLKLQENQIPKDPAERTPEYYKKRPCVKLVGIAASIVEEYLPKLQKA